MVDKSQQSGVQPPDSTGSDAGAEAPEQEAPIQILSRGAILNSQDIVEETMSTPEWGENTGVVIRSLDVDTRGKLMDEWDKRGDKDRQEYSWLYGMLFIHGVKQPKFSTSDLGKIRHKNAAVVVRIAQRVMALSGFNIDAGDEIRGNS